MGLRFNRNQCKRKQALRAFHLGGIGLAVQSTSPFALRGQNAKWPKVSLLGLIVAPPQRPDFLREPQAFLHRFRQIIAFTVGKPIQTGDGSLHAGAEKVERHRRFLMDRGK
jgi:hypothetical protein